MCTPTIIQHYFNVPAHVPEGRAVVCLNDYVAICLSVRGSFRRGIKGKGKGKGKYWEGTNRVQGLPSREMGTLLADKNRLQISLNEYESLL